MMWLLLSRELSEVAFALNVGVQDRRLGEALLGRRHVDLFTEAVSRTVLSSFAPAVLAFLAALGLMAQSSSTIVSDTIQTNANRIPGGKLENGVLTLHLELREGDWYPEAETGPSLKVYAFAEEGKALQVPGPLIRVPEGTEIRVTLRNSLPSIAVVHGLHQHPGAGKDVVELPPGEKRELRFAAGSAGTYQYWAAPRKI